MEIQLAAMRTASFYKWIETAWGWVAIAAALEWAVFFVTGSKAWPIPLIVQVSAIAHGIAAGRAIKLLTNHKRRTLRRIYPDLLMNDDRHLFL